MIYSLCSSPTYNQACEEIIKNYISTVGNYIVNGDVAKPGEFPYMAYILTPVSRKYSDCGGSLISPTYVMTAAHCVDQRDKSRKIIVRTGTLKKGIPKMDPNTDVTVAEVTIHPGWNSRLLQNDLALLRLSSPIKTTANVSLISLATSETDPNVDLVITGWGRTSDRGQLSPVLLKADFKLVSYEICNKSFGKYVTEKKQLCAMSPTRSQDTCKGDSGSPLAVPAKNGVSRVVGVLSYGRNCKISAPKVFTSVYYYLDWIESIVWPK